MVTAKILRDFMDSLVLKITAGLTTLISPHFLWKKMMFLLSYLMFFITHLILLLIMISLLIMTLEVMKRYRMENTMGSQLTCSSKTRECYEMCQFRKLQMTNCFPLPAEQTQQFLVPLIIRKVMVGPP